MYDQIERLSAMADQYRLRGNEREALKVERQLAKLERKQAKRH